MSIKIGTASNLNMLLARVTRAEHYCALVDMSGVFDAQFAAEIDVDMEKLLWVRCGGPRTKECESERVALLSEPMSLELMMAGPLNINLIESGGVLAGLTDAGDDVAGSVAVLPEREMKKPVQGVSLQEQVMVAGDARQLRVELIESGGGRGWISSGSLTRRYSSYGSLGRSRLDLKQRMKPLEKAFKAADILLQNGGFGMIAVDLSGVDERLLRKVPKATWFRFSRVAEKTQTTLVFLASYPAAGNCSAWTLRMKGMRAIWSASVDAPHTNLLSDVSFGAEITCSRRRGKKEFPKMFAAPPKMPVTKVEKYIDPSTSSSHALRLRSG
jgi:recombination protein RecA